MKAITGILEAAAMFGATVVVSDEITARLADGPDGETVLLLEPKRVPADARSTDLRETPAKLEKLEFNQDFRAS